MTGDDLLKAVSKTVSERCTWGIHYPVESTFMYGSGRTLEDVESQAIRMSVAERRREWNDSRRVKERSQNESRKRQKKGEQQESHAGGQLQVVYRLDKAEIVTYRESRVTFRGIMIHCGMMLFIRDLPGVLVYILDFRYQMNRSYHLLPGY